MEHKEEEDGALTMDEEGYDHVAPWELKVEEMLASRLSLDAVDMGTLPNADYNAWASSKLHRTSSEYSIEERRISNHSPRTVPREDSPSPRFYRVPSLQRLRTSASSDKLDEMTSPKNDGQRRSSNLAQMLTTLKKSPSMDFTRLQRDEHANSPPPPPPSVDAHLHNMGPRRQSNLAVMRVIAESM